MFRTTHEVSTKLYFVEISQVSEKLWLLNHKELILGFQILDFFSLFSLLKVELVERTVGVQFCQVVNFAAVFEF